ncbi:unnamed protein product [Cuscuta europaea]|uniref:BHLH domain-containing protein n=1 Tax=Cuscuta europaea TaxID=41803 RepID=A0A9P0ZZA3_CUSEU|nr:unnamed protein product [Cuscuta europaea]
MALQTVIYPQDTLIYGCNREFYRGCYGFTSHQEEEVDTAFLGMLVEADNIHLTISTSNMDTQSDGRRQDGNWEQNSSPEAVTKQPPPFPTASCGRRKRRRTRSCKNKEELETQRMTHIAVERNRRKQMNEYLSVIRSIMPPSYVQRGDQASIIGGAINYVKELEHHLQTLEARNRPNREGGTPLFADFFSFPQYSNSHGRKGGSAAGEVEPAENRSALADIEVTMVESHASVKILSRNRSKQLLKLVARLQCIRLSVLHLNVTTVDQTVLYSLSLKLEDGCQLTTVDEIADAVHELLARIQEEAAA